MKITGETIDKFPLKLRPLMDAFTSSPIRVAPEREGELTKLLDQHGIEIHLKPDAQDWMFDEWRMGKKIFIGTRTLERLWAYVYGYNAIITELQKAGGVFSLIRNPAEYQLGFNFLKWAKQETLEDREGQWPETLPDPLSRHIEHVEAANHFFLMAAGRMLLHEFAHAIRNHSTDGATPPDVKKTEELEADSWANSWMLDKWKEYKTDERVFIGRCMGIAFAHTPTFIYGIDKQEESQTHPAPVKRFLSFVDRWLPSGNPSDKRRADLPCAFLLVIIGHLLWEKEKPFEYEPWPTTYHELFTRFEPYFK